MVKWLCRLLCRDQTGPITPFQAIEMHRSFNKQQNMASTKFGFGKLELHHLQKPWAKQFFFRAFLFSLSSYLYDNRLFFVL